MNVAFDPVAGDVTVAGEDGVPVFHAPAHQLYAKHYRDEGILYLELRGAEAWLAFYDQDARPGPLALEPQGDGRWRVRVGPAPA